MKTKNLGYILLFLQLLTCSTVLASSQLSKILNLRYAKDLYTRTHLQKLKVLESVPPLFSEKIDLPHLKKSLEIELIKTFPQRVDVNLYNVDEDNLLSAKEMAILVSLENEKRNVVGFSSKIFSIENGEVKYESGYIKKDINEKGLQGFSKDLNNVFQRILPLYGVHREYIEADWIGRYVWIKAGYKMDSSQKLSFNGDEVELGELVVNNFKRFLKHREIAENDVCFSDGIKLTKLTDYSKLMDLSFLLTVQSCSGKKVKFHALVDDSVYEDGYDHLGKSFVLDSPDKKQGQKNSIFYSDMLDVPLSDRSLPIWRGFKDF